MDVLTAVDHDRIAALHGSRRFFWLDLVAPSPEDLNLIADALELHPAAVEDTLEWDQTPKLDHYDDHVMLVFFSAVDLRPLEVHVYAGGDWIVTVSQEPTRLADLRDYLANTDPTFEDEIVYHVLNTLADGWDPVIDEADREVDTVEAEVLDRPQQRHLKSIYRLKQCVGDLQRVAGPQRDIFPAFVDALHEMPDVERGSREWLRDVTSHLDAVAGDLDRITADLSALTDTFFNANANRLNRLATVIAVASIFFLVWTLYTGFFGQNFKYLVEKRIDEAWEFYAYGIALPMLTTFAMAGLLWWRRRDWW